MKLRKDFFSRIVYRYLFFPFRPSRIIKALVRKSYAQTGEDLILDQLMPDTKKGIYVDVGCGHPLAGSNTFYFYERDWRGLSIDANRKFRSSWKLMRPRDRFVNCSIEFSELNQNTREFFNFYADVYSSFDKDRALSLVNQGLELKGIEEVPVKDLSQLVKMFLKDTQESEIQLLSIDVEGLELEVLRSFPFPEYMPEIICVEELTSPIHNTTLVREFLEKLGYLLVAYTGLSSIYKKQNVAVAIDRA